MKEALKQLAEANAKFNELIVELAGITGRDQDWLRTKVTDLAAFTRDFSRVEAATMCLLYAEHDLPMPWAEQDVVLALMQWLNARLSGTEVFFDCGEFGVLQLRWSHGRWWAEWIDVRPCPFDPNNPPSREEIFAQVQGED